MSFGTIATGVFNTNPISKSSPAGFSGRVRVLTDTVTYASQASGTTITVGGGKLPVGAQVIGGYLVTSVTAGATATLAVGISGSTGKYRSAATLTTANVPQWFGNVAGLLTPLTAEETILITTAADALPASGTLDIVLLFVVD